VAGEPGPQGEPGEPGKNGIDGKDGQDFNMDESLALNAALSLPAWLQQNENFSVSGGLGFSDGGETALGLTGIMRLDQSWAAFGGVAVSTDGGAWAGKAGARVGW
jgi:hypothetical protein